MNQKNIGIPMTDKALLFINGIPPENLPETVGYSLIACSDGAFHYLKEKSFPMEKLDFISGDFDSHLGSDGEIYQEKFIFTPDQDKTDFHKSLEIIKERGIKAVHVYGASGGEMDHFLGNLTVAFLFKNELEITFYDEFSTYFFAPKNLILENVRGKTISLYPFPLTENITTKGLNWPLNNDTLDLSKRIGTRNFASEETVVINYGKGDLVVFVEN
ncbi:thiamine diphosphokinase [Chryseobacterium sp. HSC-36S06]|uniref:thiamine diphosphokinase n=1 Tax=Chryseobacterium sp. HSC-36S06 TaxID=2910970 RepID=UPI0020A0902E|nr:thiamine diphosphokinase [Chryseobacterium sp. HSC-36S06]MCP2037582.1 thiamine pyrophosphokinase [Chryseobacterium sp. HSC-36S06]